MPFCFALELEWNGAGVAYAIFRSTINYSFYIALRGYTHDAVVTVFLLFY